MSKNKILVCVYCEGATDDVFYKRVRDHIKSKTLDKRFCVDKIKSFNIKGISNLQTKVGRKFRNEIMVAEFEVYKKIVVLCYDKDVFEYSSQYPKVDREKVKKDLLESGADTVIEIVADKSIEDLFLIDKESIFKTLKLSPRDLKGGTGYEKLKNLYKQAGKVYYKGEKVEPFVEKFDIEKICKHCCKQFRPLCKMLTSENTCSERKDGEN